MSEREKLIECSKAIKTALMSNDTGALENLYSENFRGFSINGDVETLEVILEAYQPGAVKLKSYELINQKAEVFGEVGIISGTGYVKGSYGEHKFEHRLCFTDIYRNLNGMWKCYRSHATELPST
ncbi:MAG: nuclear transport factor 2 family protein [Candidatus Aminicenantes bacterium]|nr:nuclear transport factor 2 family protein [Candidatus Aminicenantes bacterium]